MEDQPRNRRTRAPGPRGTLLSPRTKLVAFTHCSNVVGSINAVREFTDLAHRAGAWAFVDGVAFAPHGMPDLAALGVDAYYFSLYKVYGPHLGTMFLRREVNAALPNQGHFFNEGKPGARFTPAGPDHAQIAAVNGVLDYMDAVADRHGQQGKPVESRAAAVRNLFRAHETALLQPLLDFLVKHPKVRLIGRSGARRAGADRLLHGQGTKLGGRSARGSLPRASVSASATSTRTGWSRRSASTPKTARFAFHSCTTRRRTRWID